MFKNQQQYPQQKGTSSIDDMVSGLVTTLAAIAALMSCAQIYDLTFEWAYAYFTDAWDSEVLGELSGYAFVGLSTLTVFRICQIALKICFLVLAENALMRFAF